MVKCMDTEELSGRMDIIIKECGVCLDGMAKVRKLILMKLFLKECGIMISCYNIDSVFTI
jgi:hypothetical protein